ncbi:MAG: SMP-30/gluconolactonase/LRE family protein [Verrucomicrobia bacterium]|nr:SMP-30/gluconolactonase/LRE family protein [Verrucomicrobiota bacterium]
MYSFLRRVLFPTIVAALPAFAAEPIKSLKPPYETVGKIERFGPEIDALIPAEAKIEKLAEGFNWSEGPSWWPHEQALIFSDVPENVAYRWTESDGVTVFLKPSGFTGEKYEGREPGSNGITVDNQGRLVLAQHGDRRIARYDAEKKTFVTVADRFEGKPFNSPNDLCFDRAGNVFFTDPPYGLPTNAKSEIGFNGVYRATPDGKVTLITRELERPNGIALSLDQRTLYVANTEGRTIILAIELRDDGTPGASRVFFDMTPLMNQGHLGAPDGMRVDRTGNIWATGPGGVLILSPEGKHLGTIVTGQATANCTFGPDDAVLYITADSQLLRVRLK